MFVSGVNCERVNTASISTLLSLLSFQRGTNTIPDDIKQLLDEVEHDIMNYQNRDLCCLLKPKAEADNTDMRF